MTQSQCRATTQATRRKFLINAGVGLVAATLCGHKLSARGLRAISKSSIILGKDQHTYEWISDWAKLPSGMQLGSCHGGIVIDSQSRILLNTETENAVMIFDSDGKFIKAWGKEFKSGSHGLMIRKEGKSEFLFMTHTARHELIKLTLDGELIWTRGYPEQPGIYKEASEYKPTAVAFAPNGDFYVADGYGKFFVHHYNAKAEYVRSWGGMGTEPGKLNNPHGIWVDTRRKTPILVVADRRNHRLQTFSLDGKHLGFVTEDMRRPSNIDERKNDLAVADLDGKVTILNKDNQVITHLGDNLEPSRRGNNRVPRDQWQEGVFVAPHCPRWDNDGNLYVHEWLAAGRITKLKRL